ncbi:Threonylcarbamoyladenosine tRNA methylthiotransferase, partial [Xenotaenia resolanae]
LIPGTQKIWMKTWGCSHNNSDGEYMAGQLAASGYKMTGKKSGILIDSMSESNMTQQY